MACRRCWGSAILLSLGLVLVVSSFCHGIRHTKLKALDKVRGNSAVSHGETEGSELHLGKLLIGQNTLQGAGVKGAVDTENLLEINTGYQADMGWGKSMQPKGHDHGLSRQRQDSAAVERLLRMEPKVECTRNSMKLQVHDAASTPGSLLFVDRGSLLSPLPMSKLPASCGYSIRSTRRDLVLVAPYDGCFVAMEEDTYVLPLRWWGLPVKMSCPLMRKSSPNPPMVTCHAEGMVVKMESTTPVADIKVNLTGDWEPLMTASPRCGFSVVAHPEGVVISVHYAPCLKKKDGMYTLEIAEDAKISCPSLSPAEPTKKPVKDPNQQTKAPSPAIKPQQPPQPEAPRGQGYHPYYPSSYYPQPEAPSKVQLPYFPNTEVVETPAEKPTAGPKLEASQGPIYHQFYHYSYPLPESENKPATKPQRPSQPNVPQPEQENLPATTEPPQPESPSNQEYQPIYHYPFYPQSEQKNPLATKPKRPPQPEAPQGQVHQILFPQPESEKPPAERLTPAPKPSQPDAPLGQVYYYPYYPQPNPENKPTKPTAPTKPEVPQGQVHQPLPTKPAEKPTAAPPQPEDHQSQMLNPFYYYPYYPQPNLENKPATKPTAPLEPTKPEVPQGQVHQPFPPKPAEKPTAAPAQPQPEAHQSQMLNQFYYYPYYPQPNPENKPATKPTAPPEPTKPEVPQGQVRQPFPPKAAEKPTAAPAQPQPEDHQSQMLNPFYYYPYYPQPNPENKPATKPTAPLEPTKPEVPQGQVHQPFPPKPAEKPTAAPAQPQPEAHQSQMLNQFYYYPYYPQPNPENKPATKPTAPPEPTKPEVPQGQVHQPFPPKAAEKPFASPELPQPEVPQSQMLHPFYRYPTFAHPEPENQLTKLPQPENPSAKKPAAPNQQPEATPYSEYKPFYPYGYTFFSQPEPASQPTVVPKPSTPRIQLPKPDHSKIQGTGANENAPPERPVQSEQLPNVKNPKQPQYPHYSTLPHSSSVPQAQQTNKPVSVKANQQHSNGGIDSQNPQSGPSYMQPVYCPRSCLSGLSNCCVQIAFHQHLHHIVPAKEKDQGLPFLPSGVYSGFDQGLGLAHLPQMPASAPVHSQSLPSENRNQPYHQPSDVNPDAMMGSNPSKATNQQPSYPYVVPNPLPQWPNEFLQKLPGHYSGSSEPHTPSNNLVNQVQHGQPSGEEQNKPLPSNSNSMDSEALRHNQAVHNPHPYLVPHYLHQAAQAHAHGIPSPPSQPFVSGSKESEQSTNGNSEPKSYVLLQHGPPGRETHGFNGPPLPARDLVHDSNILAQNLARYQNTKPQQLPNAKPLQEKPQFPKWTGIGLSKPWNMNYMQRPGDGSSLLQRFSAPVGPHFLPSPQDPSFSAQNSKPKLPDLWTPTAPLDSGKRIPPPIPAKPFQQWSSAVNHPGNGLNQPVQGEGGNRKQKLVARNVNK